MLRTVPAVAATSVRAHEPAAPSRIPVAGHHGIRRYEPDNTPSGGFLRSTVLLGLVLASAGCAASGGDGLGGTEDGVNNCETDAGGKEDGMTECGPAELCDGVHDDNCDGTVDEDCGRCPLMTIACPTGCCEVDSWQVGTARATGAEIAVDATGRIFFAYTKPSSGVWQAVLAIYDAVPGTWREVSLGSGTYRNRVRIDAMGRVHVANAVDAGGIWYRRSDDHGVTFTTPLTAGVLGIGGTFDMEIDSAGQPHIAYAGDAPYSSFSNLRYTHLVGSTWTTEIVDPMTLSADHPDLALGFADRPHIVFEGFDPPGVSGPTKRYAFHNGNRWIAENLDVAGEAYYTGHRYFSASSLQLAPDDSREVLFTRRTGTTDTLILARRGSRDSDTWQLTPITGATEVTTPTMFRDHHGKRGAVSDGLRLHREDTGTTWTTAEIEVPGLNVAVARRGRYLYLGYTGGTTSGPPTVKVIDLEP